MKRFFSAVLVFLMFFGGAPAGMAEALQMARASSGTEIIRVSTPVFVTGGVSGSAGAAAISREQAIAIAKGIFPEIGSMNANAQLNAYQGSGRWMLSWSDPASATGQVFTSNDIELDAFTGALDGFNISDWKTDKTGSPLIARDEALQKAEEFIRQYHPEELARAVLSSTPEPNYGNYKAVSFVFNFYWDRVEQGIPVWGDGIQVGVDPFSGRIVNCSFSWHAGVTFPNPVAVDATRKAQLMDQFGVILCYQAQPGQLTPQGAPEASLVYLFNCSPSLQIDPASGHALSGDGKPVSLQDYVLIPGLTPAVPGAVYSSGPVAPPAQEVGQDVAEKNADRFFQALGLSGKVVASGGSGNSWDGTFNDKIWSYTLQSEEDSEIQQGQQPRMVGIYAATGEVRNYVNFRSLVAIDSGNKAVPTLTPDEARDRALTFIKQVSPGKMGQIAVTNPPGIGFYTGGAQEVLVYFTRLIDGVPFPQDNISVVFDQSGQVVNYNCNWHQVALAPPGKIITADQARQILLQNVPLKAEYSFPMSLATDSRLAQGNGIVPSNPVFALRYQSEVIAADTGKQVSAGVNIFGIGIGSGAEQQPASTVPRDHWAAAPLSILADSGLLPAEGFKPDGAVTRREALRVLMGAFRSISSAVQPGPKQSAFNDVALNDPDYNLIQAAVDRDILDPGPALNPDGTLARATFVQWLVRAMGYRQVAEMPANIGLNFSDLQQVSGSDRNYAAIAEGLAIIKGDTHGMFHPDDPLTWAELATMVAAAAPRLQAL